jgi:predicted Zn-dependent protease
MKKKSVFGAKKRLWTTCCMMAFGSVAWTFPLKMKDNAILNDSEVQAFLGSILNPALRTLPHAPRVKLYVVGNSALNAFAIQEPSIFVFSGLILAADGPGEVAAVLYHELGHVIGHHALQGLEEMRRTSSQGFLTLLLGVLASVVTGSPAPFMAGMTLGNLNATAFQMSHSRDHECFADRFALKTLEKLNYPHRCFTDFMQKLLRMESMDYPFYLRTHPYIKDRIHMAKTHVRAHSGELPKGLEDQFYRTKIKLLAFTSPLEHAKEAVEQAKVPEGIKKYGHAIVAFRLGKARQALERLASFQKQYGDSPYIQELKAQILFEAGNTKEALVAINRALHYRPLDGLMGVLKAQIALENQNASDVIPLLERLVCSIEGEESAELWYWLSVAYGRNNQLGRMKICMAEQAFAMEDFQKAKGCVKDGLKRLSREDPYYQRAKELECALLDKK